MLNRLSLLVKELLAAIVLYGLITEIVVIIVAQDKIFYTIGLTVGLIAAAGMCIHMQMSLEDAIDIGEGGAEKHIRKTYGIRMTVVLLIMGLMYYFNLGSILMYFVGIMSLKVAAYLQPFTHKYFQKYIGKGR